MSFARKNITIYFLILLSIFVGCKKTSTVNNSQIVIAIPSDVERINPLFAFSINEANINELIFLSLVKHSWDNKTGDLKTEPMLATSWEWNGDSSAITLDVRDDVKWSDGVPLTLDDVIFSFDVYSDPLVESYLYGSFKCFNTDKDEHIIASKTFEELSRTKLKITFAPGSVPSLYNLDFPIVPKHIFEKIPRKEFATAKENFAPVTSGPFTLEKWEKNQAIILKANPKSFLYKEGTINRIIFKVIPEYNARLTQLKNGEVDLAEYLKPENVSELKKLGTLNIASLKGREYDYLGWNNLDPALYKANHKIVPNKFFGSVKVRQALSMAINRNEILSEYLRGYGELANSPISPIFKNAVDENLKPYTFDLEKAKSLLAEEGWVDKDNDGILEKNGVKFKFTLTISSNNPRRIFAATLIKNTFKQLGIAMNIEQLELGMLIDRINTKSVDAWMASWIIPIPLDLKFSWYSNLATTPMNFPSYQNKELDALLDKLETKISRQQKNEIYKKIEALLYRDQPVTFLYWIDNIVAYNKKIKNIDVTTLGTIHHCWLWQ
ncbi:MAG: ABC transporter substrate-binding protein [Ignavibacteriaceae bacterium]|jgi:peptide/nickel transport system substrate-binding protein